MFSIIFLHIFMELDDEDDDDGHANIFRLERQSKAAAHRVKLRPERIPKPPLTIYYYYHSEPNHWGLQTV